MKRKPFFALAAALCLAVLAGCAAPGSTSAGSSEPCVVGGDAVSVICRIVDGAAEGELLLAGQGQDEGLYRLKLAHTTVSLDGQPAHAADLADGMLVTVYFDGQVLESYPMTFDNVIGLEAQSEGADDRCGLVLEVFEDLWNTDEGLNDGIVRVGVDVDAALVPNAAERAGIAWRFGELRGLESLQGTWEELREQGYIDKEVLVWQDGCFFAFHAAEGAKQTDTALRFDAQKWRGGDGAYFFQNCTAAAEKGETGGWSYQVGVHAIA